MPVACTAIALVLTLATIASAEPYDPQPVRHGAWSIASFREDAGLTGRFVLTVSFDAHGTAWFATADGLHSFDGYAWHRYSTEDGLPSNFVRCATVASDGVLWIGTDDGVATFDGSAFRPLAGGERLAGPNVRRIVEDTDGTIWFCSDTWLHATRPMGLTRLRDGVYTVYREADGLPSDYVSDYFRDSRGRQFVATRRGLAQWDGARWSRPLEEVGLEGHDAYVWSIVESPEFGVIVATKASFFVLKDHVWSRFENNEPALEFPKLGVTRDGTVLAVPNLDGKVIRRWTGTGFEPLSEAVRSPGSVEYVAEGLDGSVWCVGFDLLLRWERRDSEWVEYRELPGPQFVDENGDVWFADERGAIRKRGDDWARFGQMGAPLWPDATGGVWGHTTDAVVRLVDERLDHFGEDATGLTVVTATEADEHGTVWLGGADGRGRNAIARYDGSSWWIATSDDLRGGPILQIVAESNGHIWIAIPRSDRGPHRIVGFDGTRFESIDLPDEASLYSFYAHVDEEHRLWCYGEFGAYTRVDDAWVLLEKLPGGFVLAVYNDDDDLWFAYTGLSGGRTGLSRRRAGRWTHFEAPLSRIVSIPLAERPYFSGTAGLLRIPRGSARASGDAPMALSLPVAGELGQVVSFGDDELWIGIGSTVLRYRPDRIPPETHLVETRREIFADEALFPRFDAVERFKPRGTQSFTYSWRFDDEPWSPFAYASPGALRPALPRGSHVLEVRARDEGLDVDPTPARLTFDVLPTPLQQRAWFWPVVTATFIFTALLGVIALASRWRVRAYATELEDKVRTRTATLRESEERFRRLVEYATDAFFLMDADGTIVDVNERACTSLGYARDRLLGRAMADIDATWNRSLLTGVIAELKPGGAVTTDSEHRRRDGSTFPVESHAGLIAAGGRKLVLSLVRDITERKQVEQRQRQMMNELDHRVKNNLATVLALSNQTLATSSSLDGFRRKFTGRIHSLARVHESLARHRWEGVDLADTVRHTLEPYAHDDESRISTSGTPVRLPSRIATAMGLALHELATNAAKHGSLSHAAGQLEVKWDEQDDTVLLSWIESGGPPVANPVAPGFGIRLIRGLVEHEIRGDADLRFEPGGLVCELRVPLEVGHTRAAS